MKACKKNESKSRIAHVFLQLVLLDQANVVGTYGILSLFSPLNICLIIKYMFWGFFWSFKSHSRILSLIWRRHHWCWRAANFWPMVGTYGHWAVWVLKRVTPTVTRDISEDPAVTKTHLLPSVWQWSCHYLVWTS